MEVFAIAECTLWDIYPNGDIHFSKLLKSKGLIQAINNGQI